MNIKKEVHKKMASSVTTESKREFIILPVHNENNVYITKKNIKKILRKGGIHREDIENIELWQEAFVHESYCRTTDFVKNEKFYGRLDTNYDSSLDEYKDILPLQEKTSERLEWLGDGILQSVIANYLFRRYPNHQEGFLTKLRSRLVKTKTLSILSKELGLDRYIMISKHKEVIQNGRMDDRILEDAFEAFIGAMSLEFGREDEMDGIRVCKDFIIHVYEANINFTALINTDDNYKDQLMRYFHKTFDGYFPTYELRGVDMVEMDNGIQKRRFHILVKNPSGDIVGEGVSFMKQDAEIKAAKAALNYYGITDGY